MRRRSNGKAAAVLSAARPEPKPDVALAPKQIAIIQYIANGKRNEEIALLMNTSEAAIWNQLVRIKDLTGCATSASVVSWALRRKMIS